MEILFFQGGGKGAYTVDEELVDSLRHALGSSYRIGYPRMPDEDDPDYAKWKPVMAKEIAKLKSEAILVGHSLGASFLLKFLVEEQPTERIVGIFLIATPYWGGQGWRYEGYERVALPNDFASRLPLGIPVFMYHSRNDDTVPYAHLSLYAKKLAQARTRTLGSGHQLNDDLSEVAADVESLR